MNEREAALKEAFDMGYMAHLTDHAPEENPHIEEDLKLKWLDGYMFSWIADQEESR